MAELRRMTSSPPVKRFDWTNLAIRVASATVLIPAVLGAIWYGGGPFLLMIAIAIGLLAVEWGKMSAPEAPAEVAVTITVAVLAAVFAAQVGWYRSAWALVVAGVGRMLLLFCVTWAADICAFAVGSLLKGPKLWPRLSPNKTWSGFVGGLIGAMLVAMAFAWLTRMDLAWYAAAIVGLLGGLATMAGDLWESALKRRFGVKDSGDLIPGHGGLLDRVDGLLFATIVVAGARLIDHWGWVP